MQNELEIFKKILNTLPNSIYLKDMQGRYVWLNQASIKQLEYKHSIFDSIIGKTDFEIFTESNATEYVKNDQKVIKGRKGISTEEEVLLPNGKKLMQLSFKEPLYDDASSELMGVLGYTIDITEEKRAQEALNQANQARLRFASTAAHEVINHVSCVVSFAERLERSLTALQKILPKEMRASKKTGEVESVSRMLAETLEDCKDIRSAAEGGITAIRNISDLQHMQLNKIEVYPTLLNIQQFLDVAIRQSTYPNTNHIQIEQSIHPSVPSKMIIDMVNLVPAFGIVMGNAFRFSHPGGKIHITVKKLLENKKDCVVISVQDFGVGMHSSQIKKLSMTLADADVEPESLYSKPSVQLSRVKMYLEASKSRLEIESVLNQGTEVKLIVPYDLPAQQNSTSKKIIDPVQCEDGGEKQRTMPAPSVPICSVLLVEDEPAMRKITAQNLVALGYTIGLAKDGADAIALAKANDYAIVLLDITLPDMNGLDVMRQIRTSKGEETIFIALSSHASEEQEEYFMTEGVMALLAKPVTSKQLESVLGSALKIRAGFDREHA